MLAVVTSPGSKGQIVTRRYSLLGVPSAAGTHGPGQELAPDALRRAGLVERLEERGANVEDHGDLPVFAFAVDPNDRKRQNLERVVTVVRTIAEAVLPMLDDGATPLVIGGDCTITLGVVDAAVQRYPNVGLIYLDGDIDVSTPDTTTSGILDTMGMAHLLGSGAPELADAGSRRPLLPGDHVVAFGYDEIESSPEERAWLAGQGVACFPAQGIENAREEADRACSKIASRAHPILVHFDVDVIDSTDLPLADFPHFNEGLTYEDAIAALRAFCRHDAFGGLVVTEINPHRDPDGALVDRLVGDLVDVLT
jgi:arginase